MISFVQSPCRLFHREFKIAFRHRRDAINPLLFFILVCLLFPLSVGPSANLLQTIAPGIIWVAVLLAVLLSLDGLFRADFEDGSLELMVLSPHPLVFLVIGRLFSHWFVNTLPLILLAPVMAIALGLPAGVLMVLVMTLLLGTPVLTSIGAIGVALMLAIPQNGMLLALLVLPLYVPVLIFATSAINRAASGLAAEGPLFLLGALFVLSFTLAPPAIAAALKTGVSQ